MHPVYIADYLDKVRSMVTTDMEYLEDAMRDVISKQTNKYDEVEFTWLLTNIKTEASLFKHHLFQLQKGLEKIANQSIQNDVQ